MKLNIVALSSIAVVGSLQFASSNADTSIEAQSLQLRKAKANDRVLEKDDDCLSITDYVCSNDDYSTLCDKLKDADLADALSGGEFTLFAPNNDAFDERSDDIVPYLGADGYITKFHAIKGKTLMFDDLVCSELIVTLTEDQESRTKCTKKGAEKFQTGRGNLALGTMPKIVEPDIQVCNGVIHGVDDILLPKLKKASVGGQEDDVDVVDDANNLICSQPIRAQPKNDPWKACGTRLYPSQKTTLPNPPNVWQGNNCWNNPDASAADDMVIIGAGIGGSYVANQLRFGNDHDTSIAIFEAGMSVGGRLMSAFHSGALGLPVRPLNKVNDIAPPEYGGMRISPVYTLVFDQVVLLWETSFKKEALETNPDAQCDAKFCLILENVDLCCLGLLTPMNVGRVFYHSTRENLGKRLMEAKLDDPNNLYTEDHGPAYTPDTIKDYDTYSPYVQCIMLAVGANKYVKDHKDWKPKNAVVGFADLCSKPMCGFLTGYCGLCSLFPPGQEAEAVVSCTGYDTSPYTQLVTGVIGLAAEVVNIAGATFLYLFTVGYQRLAQSLLEGTEDNGDDGYTDLAIAPHFQRKLVAVGIGPGDFDKAVDRARELAQKQVDALAAGKPSGEEDNGPTGPIQYLFEDGSMTVSHLGYLTMLPFDAVGNPSYDEVKGIRGFEPWYEPVVNITVPNQAFKAIIEWDDFSLAEELDMIPCVEIKNKTSGSGLCDRIILDGNRIGEPGPNSQLVRQAWLWDYKQILLYQVGSNESPAGSDIVVSDELGMNFVVQKVVEELQAAVGENITIPQPSWFRAKTWPEGSLMINWLIGSDFDAFSEAFRRPFGEDINVWYGNSEMSANGALHGWAEGALAMANVSLPEITEALNEVLATKSN